MFDEMPVIESGMEYWFGVHVSPNGKQANDVLCPFVVDAGPNVSGKGLWVQWSNGNNMSGWYDMYSIYFQDNNLYLFVILENPRTGERATLGLNGYKVSANGELLAEINDPETTHFTDDRFAKQDIEYCVTAIYSEGESEAECVSIEITEVVENTLSSLEIYPNPSDGVVNIQMNEDEAFSYTLYNTQGQVVVSCDAVQGTEQLRLNQLTKGVYFLKVNTSDSSETRKIVLR